jgi:hypothetical protein
MHAYMVLSNLRVVYTNQLERPPTCATGNIQCRLGDHPLVGVQGEDTPS